MTVTSLSAPGTYETVSTQEQLAAWIERLTTAAEFAFDTETDDLDAMRANLVGLSFSTEPGNGCYFLKSVEDAHALRTRIRCGRGLPL